MTPSELAKADAEKALQQFQIDKATGHLQGRLLVVKKKYGNEEHKTLTYSSIGPIKYLKAKILGRGNASMKEVTEVAISLKTTCAELTKSAETHKTNTLFHRKVTPSKVEVLETLQSQRNQQIRNLLISNSLEQLSALHPSPAELRQVLLDLPSDHQRSFVINVCDLESSDTSLLQATLAAISDKTTLYTFASHYDGSKSANVVLNETRKQTLSKELKELEKATKQKISPEIKRGLLEQQNTTPANFNAFFKQAYDHGKLAILVQCNKNDWSPENESHTYKFFAQMERFNEMTEDEKRAFFATEYKQFSPTMIHFYIINDPALFIAPLPHEVDGKPTGFMAGDTLLHRLVRYGQSHMATELLNNLADDQLERLLSTKNSQGQTARECGGGQAIEKHLLSLEKKLLGSAITAYEKENGPMSKQFVSYLLNPTSSVVVKPKNIEAIVNWAKEHGRFVFAANIERLMPQRERQVSAPTSHEPTKAENLAQELMRKGTISITENWISIPAEDLPAVLEAAHKNDPEAIAKIVNTVGSDSKNEILNLSFSHPSAAVAKAILACFVINDNILDRLVEHANKTNDASSADILLFALQKVYPFEVFKQLFKPDENGYRLFDKASGNLLKALQSAHQFQLQARAKERELSISPQLMQAMATRNPSNAAQLSKEASALFEQARQKGDWIVLQALLELHAKNPALLSNLTEQNLKDLFKDADQQPLLPELIGASLLNIAAQRNALGFFQSIPQSSELYQKALKEKNSAGQTLLHQVDSPRLLEAILRPIPILNRVPYLEAQDQNGRKVKDKEKNSADIANIFSPSYKTTWE